MEKRTFAFDIDGVLTIDPGIDYTQYARARPNQKMIKIVNSLHGRGNRIILYSARHEADRNLTIAWLTENDVHYDKLFLGKPLANFYVDDRGVSPLSLRIKKWFGRI